VGAGLLLPGGGGQGAISEEWAQALGATLQLLGCGLKAGLSAAQLFAQAGALDPDVGAGLYAIPVFALLSAQGVPGHRTTGAARNLVGALSILVLACAWLASGETPAPLRPGAPGPGSGDPTAGWWHALLFASNSAFAYSGLRRPRGAGWSGGWQAFAVRAAVFAWLSLSPRALGLLLTERQPRWLFILQNVLLIHSAILEASTARRALAGLRLPPPLDAFRVEQPQRALMVWLAPALAAASAFQWKSPERASALVLTLGALHVALWALRRGGGG
jgi:hypothetical protein